jgi:anti-anti-sigma regulatory factor
MVTLATGFDIQKILSAENLLSPQAFLIYALGLLFLILWILAVVILKGGKKDAAKSAEFLLQTNRRLSELRDFLNALHDGFSTLQNEFKFFKEKVMVKLNSNGRVLELLPKVADQIADGPSTGGGGSAETDTLKARLIEKEGELSARDDKIRSLELEVENFHKILEGKSLDEAPSAELEEGRQRIKIEREELEREKKAFEDNQEKIKQEIQLASDKLRQMKETMGKEQEQLNEERAAIEQEKADLARMEPGDGAGPPAEWEEERNRLLAERGELEEEVFRLQEQVEELQKARAEAEEEDEEEEEEEEVETGEEAEEEEEKGAEETAEAPREAEAPASASPSGWGQMLAGGSRVGAPAKAEAPAAEPKAEPEPAPAPVEEKPAEEPETAAVAEAPQAKGIDMNSVEGILRVTVGYEEMKRPEAQELIDQVFEATEEKSDRILLDFSTTSYINSSGMSAITKIAVERDCQIVLTNKDILKVIDLMGFLPLLNINETLDEALAAFQEAS